MILAQRLSALNLSLNGVKAVAVGEATAQAAREKLGVEIDVDPREYGAEALAAALRITSGERILLPQSEIARPTLKEELSTRGANVTAIPAYRTVRGSGGVNLAPLLRARQIDAVTFTSSSTARYFVERLHAEGGSVDGVCIACIGAQTRLTAQESGLTVTVEAETHTIAGLISGLSAYFAEQS